MSRTYQKYCAMGMTKEPKSSTTKSPRYLFLPFLVCARVLNVDRAQTKTVSYTHLTLPTIYSV